MHTFRHLVAAVAVAVALLGAGAATQAMADPISNTATMRYRTGGAERTLQSNTVVLVPTPSQTSSQAGFLRPVTSGDGVAIPVEGGQCRRSDGAYQPIVGAARGARIRSGSFAPGMAFHAGDDLFVRVVDGDRNADATRHDTVEVTIRASTEDSETLRLLETDVNSGVFAGYLPTRSLPPTATPGDCVLTVGVGVRTTLHYADASHDGDVSEAVALIDPYGVTFDAETGEVLDGIRVTIVDAATGAPAAVFGDDGVSAYPASVVSGRTVTDAGGTVYPGVTGHYRFPLMSTGTYRLVVEAPTGFRFPSTADRGGLSGFTAPDGTILEIVDPSYGGAFELIGPAPLRVDLPLDLVRTGLLLDKTASVAEAEAGDFVQYKLTLQNPNILRPLRGARLVDTLPEGLTLQAHSLRLNGMPAEPTIEGRTLTLALGDLDPAERVEVGYVARVAPALREGLLINRAQVTTTGGVNSNEARASLRVTAPLMTGVLTLIGRVTEGACDAPGKGVPGVRVLLEDGSYVVTDKDGLYHFEGVRPGVHVLQLDVGRLPAGLEPLACSGRNRDAGRAFSQFVDAGGGALWRGDFRLRRTAAAVDPATVAVEASSDAQAAGGETDFLAGATPGVGWVFPQADHNPRAPALRVAVKHAPAQSVTLSLNGKPVEGLTFDGVQTRGGVAVSVWRGVPLADGPNRLLAEVSGGDAPPQRLERTVNYANAPAHAAFVPARSRLSADGVSRPTVAVRFTDAGGHPIRAGTTGTYRVDAPYRPAADLDAEQARQLAGQDAYATQWRIEGDDGVALIPLAPTTESGAAVLNFDFADTRGTIHSERVRAWLEAGQQDWVVVGFAAGTLGHATLSDRGLQIEPAGSDATTADGQVSLYAKGRIGGDWLLTLAYDSEKPTDREGRRRFQSGIDPGRYYTIYGDGSEQAYDASSAKKLYLRLDRKQAYALFGDFETGLNDTQLSRYGRSLTGLKAERNGEMVRATAFAANTDLRFAREELPGTGLAGLYRLARRDLVINSDRVTVEVRDRFRSERIVERRPLTRHIDYDIDYDTGGLTFREPILSRDRDGNPVFVVVEYETVGAAGETLTAGGRITATLARERVVLGATAVHEEADRSTTRLAGVDAKVRVNASTELRLELAATQRESDDPEVADADGIAYLAEIEHRSARLELLAYVREQQADFGLGQQSAFESGARKVGVDGRYDLTERLSLVGKAYREDFESTGGSRDVVEALIERRTDLMSLRAGLRHVADRVDGRTLVSDEIVLGGSRSLLDRRLELTGERSFGLGGGEGESVDFPSRTRVGASYALREDVRLVVSHEIAEGAEFDAANTQLGIDATPWGGARLAATLRQAAIGENGSRTFAQFGAQQSFVFGERWGADLSIDSGRTLAGTIDPDDAPQPDYPRASGGTAAVQGALEDFWAVSAGGTFRSELWSWTGRAEVRDGSEQDRLALSSGVLRQTRSGVSFAAGAYGSRVDDVDGGSNTAITANLSWAYRPLESRWSLLDKLELRIDEQTAGEVDPLAPTLLNPGIDAKLRRVINNLAVNYTSTAGGDRADRRDLQMSLYYGSKYVFDRFDGADYDGYTHVLGVEARWQVSPRFDVGFGAAVQHAWTADEVAFAFGPSIGVSPADNAWVSVGWNVVGFEDRDSDRYTREGPYVAVRFKFDQLTPRDLRRVFDRAR